MQLDGFEALTETLLELKQSKEREARLAEENRVILASLSSLSTAENKYQIFDELNRVIAKYIPFDDFVVISKGKNNTDYETFLSSNNLFVGKKWNHGDKFVRVLQGESILLYETSSLEEFCRLSPCLKQLINTVLITGIKGQVSDLILLMIGHHSGKFSVDTKQTLSRFRPLLERAIIDIELKEELQRLVEVRTHELQEARLAAEKASHAKSEFLAMMSHEIRTPLSAVLGIVDVMRENSSPEQQLLLEKMEGSAELLHAIISDILDLSKIESGHFQLNREWTQLNAKLTHAFDYYRVMAETKGIDFFQSINVYENHSFYVDSVRVVQIISNLVGNAVKFTEKGSVNLLIQASLDQLTVRVKDTGIGIDKDRIDRLYSPFFQVENGNKRQFGGTGLGLTITKRLVDLMHGKISLTSNPGVGTEFELTIPLVSRRKKPTVEGELSDKITSQKQNQPRILVVEDTPTNQMVIKLLLNQLGLSVEIANNGVDALEILDHQVFDLVFMDISMPLMDGFEATKQIRERGMTIPIIALTAHSITNEKSRYLNSGFNDVVMKPARKKQLFNVLSEYLDL
ncbi:ATP-binding protein [Vibrio viridaestus]|uniref:histidine kinase n=1 Tax=Vibrio viridaestus TaxID=2487322 RepID=A0A3N9TI62_9VIBR|nr:ATP-binding protein [Vibrio viridaestus]RQW63573.1 response regulator [Vibrio viridaestus]